MTHPFHPLSGQQLVCVGERYNRYGKRLLLQVDAETVCSVPPQWTDVVVPDLELAMGKGRALLRVSDLLELAQLVADLSRVHGRIAPEDCKVNSAASVKKKRRKTKRITAGRGQSPAVMRRK